MVGIAGRKNLVFSQKGSQVYDEYEFFRTVFVRPRGFGYR